MACDVENSDWPSQKLMEPGEEASSATTSTPSTSSNRAVQVDAFTATNHSGQRAGGATFLPEVLSEAPCDGPAHRLEPIAGGGYGVGLPTPAR